MNRAEKMEPLPSCRGLHKGDTKGSVAWEHTKVPLMARWIFSAGQLGFLLMFRGFQRLGRGLTEYFQVVFMAVILS